MPSISRRPVVASGVELFLWRYNFIKVCTSCKLNKDESQFYSNVSNTDRKAYDCKACRKIYERNRNRRIELKKFGLSETDYLRCLESQKGCCAICKRDKPDNKGNWSWMKDHDHKTGKFRGLLCITCNLKLGWVDAFLPEILGYLNYSV